jgi:hypothetical protein
MPDDQGMEFSKHGGIFRQVLLEFFLNPFIGYISFIQKVRAAGQSACIRIDNEEGLPSAVTENAVRCFGADASSGEQPFSGVGGIGGAEIFRIFEPGRKITGKGLDDEGLASEGAGRVNSLQEDLGGSRGDSVEREKPSFREVP